MSHNVLDHTRVYLSGPMDFVGSRVVEKYLGWRAILTPILKALGVTPLDPWNKPTVKGHQEYGKEGLMPPKELYEKDFWTNKATRAKFEADFWETVHIDCRMVDVSDFVVAFVPTNIYSVGTVHEIVLARTQFKPVLMVSPPIQYDFFPELASLSDDAKRALKFYGLKENPHGIPSQWYGNVVGGNNMFDGFGWEHLPFKDNNFYPSLLKDVVLRMRPEDETSRDFKAWQQVEAFINNHKALNALKGGILDNITIKEESEKELLDTALADPQEQARTHFWYNQAYTPKRPMLYTLLRIAAGHIPTRHHSLAKLNDDGELEYQSYETPDDNWVLMQHD